ncbi:MAG: chemotaxis protein CheB [Luteolibacter sp.]
MAPLPSDAPSDVESEELQKQTIPVVGIGGSAGSLEPLQQFFSKLPANTGMAYVVVVHLSPEHVSLMAPIIQRSTSLPVIQVTEPVSLEPDHVYVIPPGKHLSMTDGILQTLEMTRPKGRHVTIDLFFRALADTHGSRATAIILSGGDGDGSIGLKRVKEQGGLTIAQDPDEAEHGSMPRSAIGTGMVDWVLPIAEMPARLVEYQENGRKIQLPPEIPSQQIRDKVRNEEKDEASLRDVLMFLKARTAHDFGSYKRATILRRIGRRMQVNGTEDLATYLAYLRTHPGETGALLQDLLISVTNFFRDPEAFATLESHIAELFTNKGSADQVRVWVPACATGEEAYSVAMLLCEHAAKLESPPHLQVFATDLDKIGIEVAREGRYPETITADVSDERLSRFFTKEASSYRVRREVREVVLFAMHDLLKDSPFSRLDLISCRNLLIYLNRDAQGKVFDIFHFALHPGGKLFLGSSESAEEASSLFAPLDKKHRLYFRRAVPRIGLSVPTGSATLSFAMQSQPRREPPILPPDRPSIPGMVVPPAGTTDFVPRNTWSELHFKLIERIAPPSLVVSGDHEIVHLSKGAGRYLQFAGGEPTMNLLRVIHPKLRSELRAALFRAGKSAVPLQVTGIPLELDGVPRVVDITVESVEDLAPDFQLVIFRERDPLEKSVSEAPSSVTDRSAAQAAVVQHLEEELDEMRSRLRETVEQYETSTEELKASNEELQAMNEELRSATEELETSREELQSINEEIITINLELKSKVEELSRSNNDLQNLMASTNIATIFLDRQLQIKRFTPSSTGLFNFILSDIGRPLSDFTHRLEYPDITADAQKVLERLILIEREVRDSDGHWFLARLLPYRTAEDQIAGVVITCVDITARKQAEESKRWMAAIVESSNDAIISFSLEGIILSWNQGAERVFGYKADEIKGRSINVLAPTDRSEETVSLLEKLSRDEAVESFETVRLSKEGQWLDVAISASVMKNEAGEIQGATAIIQDNSVRKRAVEELKYAKDELEFRVEQRTVELKKRAKQLALMASELTFTEQRERKDMAHVLHDQLQQVLVAAKMRIESLDNDDRECRKAEREKLISLIDEALVNSRSLAVELSPPILVEGLGPALVWLCSVWMKERHGMTVECEIDTTLDTRQEDMRILVFLATKELLFNVVKHSTVKEAIVELAMHDAEHLRVTVRDHGTGFDNGNKEIAHSSTGFGLMSIRERLEMLGGSLEIRSRRNHGVEATILAPRLLVPLQNQPPPINP